METFKVLAMRRKWLFNSVSFTFNLLLPFERRRDDSLFLSLFDGLGSSAAILPFRYRNWGGYNE